VQVSSSHHIIPYPIVFSAYLCNFWEWKIGTWTEDRTSHAYANHLSLNEFPELRILWFHSNDVDIYVAYSKPHSFIHVWGQIAMNAHFECTHSYHLARGRTTGYAHPASGHGLASWEAKCRKAVYVYIAQRLRHIPIYSQSTASIYTSPHHLPMNGMMNPPVPIPSNQNSINMYACVYASSNM